MSAFWPFPAVVVFLRSVRPIEMWWGLGFESDFIYGSWDGVRALGRRGGRGPAQLAQGEGGRGRDAKAGELQREV